MLIYVRFGTRLSGKVDSFAGSYIATRFFHIWYLPLIPLSSWLVLGADQAVGIPLDWRSVLAGYARGVGTLIAAGVFFSALAATHASASAFEVVVAPALLLCGVALAWGFLGRLSRDEKGRRAVYWDSLGHFVDPARLGDARHQLIENLRKDVQARAQGLSVGGYRDAYDPNVEWRKAACRPSTTDVEFLKRSLALARLEWSFAHGDARRELAREHQLIWENIKRRDATVLSPSADQLK